MATMNEILKKRIEEAAREHQSKLPYCDDRKVRGEYIGYLRGFNEGAAFALSRQWIRVEEALPECSVIVFVKDKYDNYDIAYLSKKGYWIANDGRKIIVSLWMPISKFTN